MNSSDVRAALYQLHAKCKECLTEMDICFMDFEIWKESVRDDVSNYLGNKRKLIVPTTPAGIRKRVCLPVIRESVDTDTGDADIILEKEKEAAAVTFNVPRKTRCSVIVKKLSMKNKKSCRPSNKKSVLKSKMSKSLNYDESIEDESQTSQSANTSKEINVNCNAKDDFNKGSKSNVHGSPVETFSEHHSFDTQSSSSFLTAASLNETHNVANSTYNLRSSTSVNMLDHENHVLKDCNVQNDTKSPVKKLKSPHFFSPYGNESVKKRVAAYENLYKMEQIKTTKRVTRSKARALFQNYSNSSLICNNNKNVSHMKVSASNKPATKRLLNKKTEVSKENSMLNVSKKTQFTAGSKVLSDVNRLHTSQSQLNSSKKTPVPSVVLTKVCLTGEILKPVHAQSVTALETEGLIKVAYKQSNYEVKKIEEIEKRKEKENEAAHRREELLKKKAEELRRKEEERLKVMQKREAQEKEKHENQVRAGRERDEKLNILLHEREVKQKEEVLKKKLESERKAAEARRKVEEAEATRLAKLKMDEQIRKKELQEAETEQIRRHAEEKEEAAQREEVLKSKNALKGKPEAPAKNLDSTFTLPPAKDCLNGTFTSSKNADNIYNLEDLSSGESDDDSDSDGSSKKTARWATRSKIYWESRLDLMLPQRIKIFGLRKFDMSSVFTNLRNFQRTSSAQWVTPPRYSCLPHY